MAGSGDELTYSHSSPEQTEKNIADDARGWQCPFVLGLHPQGCLRKKGASQVAQWWKIRLPMQELQETRV